LKLLDDARRQGLLLDMPAEAKLAEPAVVSANGSG
jgi:hypothetical protein